MEHAYCTPPGELPGATTAPVEAVDLQHLARLAGVPAEHAATLLIGAVPHRIDAHGNRWFDPEAARHALGFTPGAPGRRGDRADHEGRQVIAAAEISNGLWVMPPRAAVLTHEALPLVGEGRAPAPRPRAMSTPKAARGSLVEMIPVRGVLFYRARGPGMVSTAAVARAVAIADADADVGTIVLDVDSLGGTLAGVPELADALAAVRARSRTRVVAVANAVASCGAYWIASQAHELVVTPSGMVGGIGAVAVHTDVSGQRAKAGVRLEYISAGRHKAEGWADGPLTDEHRAHLQSQVDAVAERFVAAVARGRRVSADTVHGRAWGQGRVLLAADAIKVGMVDRIATLDQVLAGLIGRQAADPRAMTPHEADAAIAELMTPRHAWSSRRVH